MYILNVHLKCTFKMDIKNGHKNNVFMDEEAIVGVKYRNVSRCIRKRHVQCSFTTTTSNVHGQWT